MQRTSSVKIPRHLLYDSCHTKIYLTASVIALLQRVLEASVSINNESVAAIDQGVLVFVAIQEHDDESTATRMCERVIGYRIFADEVGKMNKSVVDVNGGVLLVPQFTLAADTKKGLRPNFSQAASPEHGTALFDYFLNKLNSKYAKVKSGKFGAHMQVHLINDGPVTFWLQL